MPYRTISRAKKREVLEHFVQNQLTIAHTARECNVSKGCARRLISKYCREGSIEAALTYHYSPPPGRKRKLTADEEDYLYRMQKKYPNATLEQLQSDLYQAYNKRMSISSLSGILKAQGFSKKVIKTMPESV